MNRRQFNLGLTTMMLGLSAIPKRLNASPQLDGQKSDRTGTQIGRSAFKLLSSIRPLNMFSWSALAALIRWQEMWGRSSI
jgi:hypothetical protein